MHTLPTPGTPRPQVFAAHVEQKRNHDHPSADETDQARRPADAQVVIHGRNHDGQDAGHDATEQGVGRHRARGVPLEGVDDVVQRRLEDGDDAGPGHDQPDHGRDPVEMGGRRPAREEDAAGEEETADHHGRQAGLGDGEVARRVELADVEVLVAVVDGAAEEDADEDGEKGCCSYDLVGAKSAF